MPYIINFVYTILFEICSMMLIQCGLKQEIILSVTCISKEKRCAFI
jgi:hypothetical protein